MTTVVLVPISPSSDVLTAQQVIDLMTAEHQWMSRGIVKEPLIGLVNGQNKTFSLSITPAASVVVTDYEGNTLTTVSVDGEGGSVVLASTPVNAVFATYTNTMVKPSAVNGIATGSVGLMETLWNRGYSFVSSGGTLYLSSSPTTITDEIIAPSQTQRKFLADCVFYTWVRSYYLEATMHAVAFREQRASGLQVDRTKQAAAFDAMLKLAQDNLQTSLQAAMIELGATPYSIEEAGIVAGRSTSMQPHSGWYNDTVFPYPWS